QMAPVGARQLARLLGAAHVHLGAAVGEVEADDIKPCLDHALEHLRVVGGGAERRDYLGAPEHRFMAGSCNMRSRDKGAQAQRTTSEPSTLRFCIEPRARYSAGRRGCTSEPRGRG